MVAVTQGRAGDAADRSVKRLNLGAALMVSAGALHVAAEEMGDSVVDGTRLTGGEVAVLLGVADARVGLLEHVFDAGSRPGPEAEEEIIQITQRIETQYRRVNPAVDRYERRANFGRFANESDMTGILRVFSRRGGLLGKQRRNCYRQESSEHGEAVQPPRGPGTFVRNHVFHFITRSTSTAGAKTVPPEAGAGLGNQRHKSRRSYGQGRIHPARMVRGGVPECAEKLSPNGR